MRAATPIEHLAGLLPGIDPTKTQQDVPCPAHTDERESLSVGVGNDGRVLIHCHAGCSTEKVLNALGITDADLFARNGRASSPPSVHKREWRSLPPGFDTIPLDSAIRAEAITLNAIENARYAYTDATGELRFCVVRYEPRDGGGKLIRPFVPTQVGWVPGGFEGIRPLYRLPEVLASTGTVYVVEGEKCVDAARSIGLTATTSAHGAESPERSDWTPFASRDVAILPDNDGAGRKYAETVASILAGLSPTPTVRIVALPDLPEHGDIADLIQNRRAAGKSDSDIRTEVERLVSAAEPLALEERRDRAVVVNLADVESEPVSWLWPGRIALGKLTLVAGDPGLGKSFLSLDIAARVSTGRPWPDRPKESNEQGSVILLNVEDDLADTVRPRLEAAGADVTRIKAIAGVVRFDPRTGLSIAGMFSLADDLRRLEETIQRTPGVRLVVIDPVSAFMGTTDSHNNAEVRGLLAPLAELAARYRVAVLAVSHLNKNANGSVMYRTVGSIAFNATARAVWGVTRDKSDPERRLMLPVKNNLSTDREGLAYSLFVGPGRTVPHVAWDSNPVTVSAEEAFSPDRDSGNRTERKEAAAWLRDVLKAGPLPASSVKESARAACISEATLRRAKSELRIEVTKEGFAEKGRWLWALPVDQSNTEEEHTE